MAALATPADMALRYDETTIGQLIGNKTTVNPGQFAGDPVLLEALDDATGEVLSCLNVGERYTVEELTANLAGESRKYLASLTCRVAYANLWRRKPSTKGWPEHVVKEVERTDKQLEDLRDGKTVLHLSPQIEAGRLDVETIGATRIQNEWALLADRGRGRVFPRRRSFRNRQ